MTNNNTDLEDELQHYRRDPARSSSLAWWETKIKVQWPPTIDILSSEDHPRDAAPQRYFKLVHQLDAIPVAPHPHGIDVRIITVDEADAIATLINDAYGWTSITPDEVRSWADRPVHDPELWLGAYAGDRLIGSAIADNDMEAGEASLDWVQVHPDWRGCGVGKALVCEVLHRASARADFATVSGDVDNDSDPEHLYRACGFEGDTIWHIYPCS